MKATLIAFLLTSYLSGNVVNAFQTLSGVAKSPFRNTQLKSTNDLYTSTHTPDRKSVV